jgi:purine nucleosidase
LLTQEDIAAIGRNGTKLSEFFLKVNEATLAWMKEHDGRAVSTHPDSLTCACMIDESLILEADECILEVETGDSTRGHSRVVPATSRQGAPADANGARRIPNARVIRRADTARFAQMLAGALA